MIDAIELEVLWQSLIATVNEQARALQRAAFSPIVREAGDLANAVVRPARPHGRPGRHRHPRPHQQPRQGGGPHPRPLPARFARAGRRVDHQRSVSHGRPAARRDRAVPGVPQGPGDRLLRFDDPPHRCRWVRHRSRGARRVRGRDLDPDLQAVQGRRAQRRRVAVHPLQRPPARSHGRRSPCPGCIG